MRELIVKLAKHITDCMDVTLGKTKMDKSRRNIGCSMRYSPTRWRRRPC